METRKIIRFGKNSYVISVPKTWINTNKLKKGDDVYIDESANDLHILPGEISGETEAKKIVIETEGKELNVIRSEIISAYLMNYNIIELVGDNVTENVTKIKNILRDLSGMEIMDLTARRVTAQDILNEEDVDITNILRRVDTIVRSMITDSIRTIKSDLYESINERDTDVNRLVFLAFRVLKRAMKEPQVARRLGMEFVDLFTYWNMISHLESIADQAKRAARHVRRLKLDEKGKREFEKFFASVFDLYLETMKAYYTKDRNTAFRIIEKCKERNLESEKLLDRYATVEAAHSIGFIKSLNGLIKHIARIVNTT